MAEIVAELVLLLGTFITFVNDFLIPATADDLTILHVAIWLPVVIGLVGMTVAFLKRMWGGKKRA